MAQDVLFRGLRFGPTPAATCTPCVQGEHDACDGTAISPSSHRSTHCECQRVGHTPLI